MIDGWRVLTLDRLEEVTGRFETCVGAVISLGGKSHGGAVGATGSCFFVVASRLLVYGVY